MSIYVVGDIQGCYRELSALWSKLTPKSTDTLWFTGDLVNRGPNSLEVLDFVSNVNANTQVVLGNHDLHLLAVMFGGQATNPYDTIQGILDSPRGESLCHWLRQKPLFHHDPHLNWCLVHAGLLPQWSLTKALALNQEVTTILGGDNHSALYPHLYGNEPAIWKDDLAGWDRIRAIVNGFTRLRFCTQSGHCDFTYKGALGNQPADLLPWFEVPHPAYGDANIAFGHWAALMGKTPRANLVAADTGCVWGHQLTAVRLEDGKRFTVDCENL